jgi:phosphoribosylglycinamide formyltransferase-1
MKNIVCLISGRGSNLEALLRCAREQQWQGKLDAQISAVISNRADARGLEIAAAHGVETHVLSHAAFADRDGFDAALRERIERHHPALVVLAGFLRVLTPAFTAHFHGRLINIHPSLLPAFTGLHTHARALQMGVRIHGTTVHFVSGELDAGPIIAQSALAVLPGEEEEALAARVLALEHELLPRCVRWILEGRVRLEGGRVATPGVDAGQLLRMAA